MLDRFVVFSKTGVVLWSIDLLPAASAHEAAASRAVVGGLIREVLLRDSGATTWTSADHIVKYAVANVHDVVFAAIASRQFGATLGYVDTLLASVRAVFIERYGDSLVGAGAEAGGMAGTFAFNSAFEKLLESAEGAASGHDGGKVQKRTPAVSASSRPLEPVNAASYDEPAANSSHRKDTPAAVTAAGVADAQPPVAAASAEPDGASNGRDDGEFSDMLAARARLAARRGGGGRPGTAAAAATTTAVAAPSKPGSASKKGAAPASSSKSIRQWDDFSYNEKAAAALDRSTNGAAADGSEGVERVTYSAAGTKSVSGANLYEDDGDDDVASFLASSAATAAAAAAGASRGNASAATAAPGGAATSGGIGGVAAAASSWFSKSAFGSMLSTLAGNKVIEAVDLEPVMDSLRSLLVSKNVAVEIAGQLCDAVSSSLVGTRVAAAGSVSATVQRALRESIERILTPRRPIDVLADVRAKKPFVMVFVGINGVGKSTSLAKMAFHLRDHGLSVLIAACDSFRSGAVEQLKRHCTALDVPLFSKGYAKDPVTIASAAIKEAAGAGIDVVLVDTAGRMQNNAPLMVQLAKLVTVNAPDLVLMVAEALVGSDGVDQLEEFDRSLVDFAVDAARPRRIDGVLLTKFDTVDDKVGASLSMVYKTGIPILFLGVGQKYEDLRRLNAAAVTKALLA